MRIGIPKERVAGERRVAATPKSVIQLKKLGFQVAVETGAGEAASFTDEQYISSGAEIVEADDVFQCDLIYKVNPPTEEEVSKIKEGATFVSFLYPAQNGALVKELSQKTSMYWQWTWFRAFHVPNQWTLYLQWLILEDTGRLQKHFMHLDDFLTGKLPLPGKYHRQKYWSLVQG